MKGLGSARVEVANEVGMARLLDTFKVDITKACKRVRMGLGFPSPKYRSTQEIIGASMSAKTIQNIAVIGLGTIGHSVVQMFAVSGCYVRCFDPSSSVRDGLENRIRDNLNQMVDADLFIKGDIETALAKITVCDTEKEALVGAEFVSEAASEELGLKQTLFSRMEKSVDAETILASNTSTHPMTDIARLMQHPDRAIVTHPFNPPHIIPVVEVVPGEHTSEQTIEVATSLLRRVGKQPVRLNKELPGFLVNRIQMAMIREIWDLLDQEVATAEDIDLAVQGSLGFRLAGLGPLKVCDFAGVDLWAQVFSNLADEITSTNKLSKGVRALVERGDYGTKSGRGFFDYSAPGVLEAQVTARDRGFLEVLKLFHQRPIPTEN